jgi:hypothetical protein
MSVNTGLPLKMQFRMLINDTVGNKSGVLRERAEPTLDKARQISCCYCSTLQQTMTGRRCCQYQYKSIALRMFYCCYVVGEYKLFALFKSLPFADRFS